MRDLTRTRVQLIRKIAHTCVQQTLRDADLKLTSVLSDITGKTGRAILGALVTGDTDPERLAALTQGRLNASRTELVEALPGHLPPHHCVLLQLHSSQIDALEAAVRDVEARIGDGVAPFQAVEHLTTMPGVSPTIARVIVAGTGIDMTRFPSAGAKKAIAAVAASTLTAGCHMLKRGVDYRDLGPRHLTRVDKAKLARRLVRRLQDLGFHVEARAAA